ncbi:MAG: SGNH/GDSL hydrolase family protein, partial [Bdellovibrionales bacterium]|nr:SGNH/GDSL hydrolase family protein [Bdellovibrionales bacterium]
MGLVLAFSVLEVALRVFAVSFVTNKPHPPAPVFFYQPINSKDAVNFRYSVPKASDLYRIAAVGDSFTYPHSIEFDDAYPARLERMLNLASDSKKIEVVNYGKPGNSTRAEVSVVRHAIEDGADMVLLEITLNDAELEFYSIAAQKDPDRYVSG